MLANTSVLTDLIRHAMAQTSPDDVTRCVETSRQGVVTIRWTSPMLNTKQKGARAERRAITLLEADGFVCTKAGGSLGIFDVIAISADTVRCVQVKSGRTYCSAIERAELVHLAVPVNVSKEIWRFPDRSRHPLVERL